MGAHGHPKKLWQTVFHNKLFLEIWTDDDIRNCLFIRSGIEGQEAFNGPIHSTTPGIELNDIVELRDALTQWIHNNRAQLRKHRTRNKRERP